MKLNETQIKNINENMIISETEKAIQLKVNYIKLNGDEKEIHIWCPKTCIEYTECGILKIKDWFRKNKENELHGKITPILVY